MASLSACFTPALEYPAVQCRRNGAREGRGGCKDWLLAQHCCTVKVSQAYDELAVLDIGVLLVHLPAAAQEQPVRHLHDVGLRAAGFWAQTLKHKQMGQQPC